MPISLPTEQRMSMMSRQARVGLVSILLLTLVTACMSPKGNTVAEKRQAVQSMRFETLVQLYEVHPYSSDSTTFWSGSKGERPRPVALPPDAS